MVAKTSSNKLPWEEISEDSTRKKSEVAALWTCLASRTSSRTVFEVLGLGLESQVLGLGLEPSRSPKIGLSSVEDSSFLLPFKSYMPLKLF